MASNQGMKDLISLINAVQDAASGAGVSLGTLDLPQIAVVGGQSAGKSSVLENFVGKDFLPRGSGIVTRCPLVLQLIPNNKEYAEFVHLPGKQFTDYSEVRNEIKNETIRIIGTGKAVSSNPISLHINSPDVLELTLVDLPGMTKVPVDDQPVDIEYQIRSMLLEFIRKDNALILAVTPANQDLANSDALNLAREVDPEGLRTIGVITKLDLMDRGTDARDILENRVYPLARGYVGIVNRCQADIDMNKDIRHAQQAEIEYFKNHTAYRHMADRMGSKYLQEILNKQLSEHIKKKLPLLNSEIKKQHATVKEELEQMNYFGRESNDWKHDQLMKLLQQFSEDIKIDLEGHSVRIQLEGKLSGGAKIKNCFYSDINKLLDQAGNPSETDLCYLLANLVGYKDNLFVPGQAFEVAVKELVNKYKDPMIKSVDLISAIVSASIAQCAAKLSEYPNLKETVINHLSLRLKKQEDKTKRHMSHYIEAQGAYMNTKHPEFDRVNRAPVDTVPAKSMLTKSHSMETIVSPSDVQSVSSYQPQIEERPITSTPGLLPMAQPMLNRAPSMMNIRQTIHKGWILTEGNRLGRKKERWFVLSSEFISWYKDEEEKEIIGSVSLDTLKLERDTKTKKFVLASKNGKAINKDYHKMSMTFKTNVEQEVWCNAMKRVGVDVDLDAISVHSNDDSQSVIAPDNSSFGMYNVQEHRQSIYPTNSGVNVNQHIHSQFDEETRDGANTIMYMIRSYMQIMDKSIRDIVPKYIALFLIQAILEYVHLTLIADVTKKELEELMEEGVDEATRKKQLLQIFEATEKAMNILNIVTFS